MRIGMAADHGGFALKQTLRESLSSDHEIVDFGADEFDPEDDYPDFVAPLARAVAAGEVEPARCLAAASAPAWSRTRLPGVLRGANHGLLSAHQGVEDDDMNVICLGAAWSATSRAELLLAFLGARISASGFERRLEKVRPSRRGA